MKFVIRAAATGLCSSPPAVQAQSSTGGVVPPKATPAASMVSGAPATIETIAVGSRADLTWRNFTLDVFHVDTGTSGRDAGKSRSNFRECQEGAGDIAGSTVLLSLVTVF